jgi:hypothetical protein
VVTGGAQESGGRSSSGFSTGAALAIWDRD